MKSIKHNGKDQYLRPKKKLSRPIKKKVESAEHSLSLIAHVCSTKRSECRISRFPNVVKLKKKTRKEKL